MNVLRQYWYLLYELPQEIKINKPVRAIGYKVKFERTKLKQKAKKKQELLVRVSGRLGFYMTSDHTKISIHRFVVFPLFIK